MHLFPRCLTSQAVAGGQAGQGRVRADIPSRAWQTQAKSNDKSKKIYGFVIDLSVKGVVSAKQQRMDVPVNSSSVA